MKTILKKGRVSFASQLRSKVGQNTAEYLLMLSIIGVGSIGLLTVFGGQIRNQFAGITAAIGGHKDQYTSSQERSKTIATRAATRAKEKVNVGQVKTEELEFNGAE